MPGKNMNMTIATETRAGLSDDEKERFKAGDWDNLSDSPNPGIKRSRKIEILAAYAVLRKRRGVASEFEDAAKNAEKAGIDVQRVLREASVKYTRPGSKTRR